ncbi:hypothetical protein, partial [Halobacillus sp. BBL2006]|uniref:hypothetical protein n=1 Tax=Halobacillus sp. BBL2006 TaxID=1543706 RepID=UPI000542C532
VKAPYSRRLSFEISGGRYWIGARDGGETTRFSAVDLASFLGLRPAGSRRFPANPDISGDYP